LEGRGRGPCSEYFYLKHSDPAAFPSSYSHCPPPTSATAGFRSTPPPPRPWPPTTMVYLARVHGFPALVLPGVIAVHEEGITQLLCCCTSCCCAAHKLELSSSSRVCLKALSLLSAVLKARGSPVPANASIVRVVSHAAEAPGVPGVHVAAAAAAAAVLEPKLLLWLLLL